MKFNSENSSFSVSEKAKLFLEIFYFYKACKQACMKNETIRKDCNQNSIQVKQTMWTLSRAAWNQLTSTMKLLHNSCAVKSFQI